MLLRFSPPSSKLSHNCPVPTVKEVVSFARQFGVGVVSVRPSRRSLSRWVAVCSFASIEAAQRFKAAAGVQFFGCAHTYMASRQTGRRWRVSVPCVNPPLFACDRRRVVRVGDRRFLLAAPKLAAPNAMAAPIPANIPQLPSAVASVLAGASIVGFSGSRRPGGALPVSAISQAVAVVPASTPVVVGCASGVDGFCRLSLGVSAASSKLVSSAKDGVAFFGRVSVFVANSGAFGEGNSAFARRSAACVSACKGGVWVAFPCSPCPEGLNPSASFSSCFRGLGSGSWASLALAAGLNISCLLFLQSGTPPSWGFIPLGGGWFFLRATIPSPPVAIQLSLPI
jgi:hypothetical protein